MVIWIHAVQVLPDSGYTYDLRGGTAISCRRARPDHSERGKVSPERLNQLGRDHCRTEADHWLRDLDRRALADRPHRPSCHQAPSGRRAWTPPHLTVPNGLGTSSDCDIRLKWLNSVAATVWQVASRQQRRVATPAKQVPVPTSATTPRCPRQKGKPGPRTDLKRRKLL